MFTVQLIMLTQIVTANDSTPRSSYVDANCDPSGSGQIELTHKDTGAGLGDVLPDFSYVGYRSGEEDLPFVETRATLNPEECSYNDCADAIDAKLAELSNLEVNESSGFRGALTLSEGEFPTSRTIKISTSGVVLRGQGEEKTTLIGTMKNLPPYSADDGPGGAIFPGSHNLIQIRGENAGELQKIEETEVNIVEDVPVGTKEVKIENTDVFEIGDTIVVERASTMDWIESIGMDNIDTCNTMPKDQIRCCDTTLYPVDFPCCSFEGCFHWPSEAYVLRYERVVKEVIMGGKTTILVLDAPMVHTITAEWGGGSVYKVQWTGEGRIRNVGVEDLTLKSIFENRTDEDHARSAVYMDYVEQAWATRITCHHFVYACANVQTWARYITIADSTSLDPISQNIGARRYSFNLYGELVLFINCHADKGRHDFSTGRRVKGPNAFVDCTATNTYADIGPHHRYATGSLYDSVYGGKFRVRNRGKSGSGHGWSGANTIFWNVASDTADTADIWVDSPQQNNLVARDRNYGIGVVQVENKFRGEGIWDSRGEHVFPKSLYAAQLAARLQRPYKECSSRSLSGSWSSEMQQAFFSSVIYLYASWVTLKYLRFKFISCRHNCNYWLRRYDKDRR